MNVLTRQHDQHLAAGSDWLLLMPLPVVSHVILSIWLNWLGSGRHIQIEFNALIYLNISHCKAKLAHLVCVSSNFFLLYGKLCLCYGNG